MHRSAGGSGVFGPLVKVVLGAGLVLVGAYVVAKLRERRNIEARLRELEKLVEKLSKEQSG